METILSNYNKQNRRKNEIFTNTKIKLLLVFVRKERNKLLKKVIAILRFYFEEVRCFSRGRKNTYKEGCEGKEEDKHIQDEGRVRRK